MTTEAVDAYGGISFAPELLEEAATTLREGGFPLHVDHDLSRPIRTRNLDLRVEERADGVFALCFTVDVHPDDVGAIGSRGFASATVFAPLARDEVESDDAGRPIDVRADHAWFDDEAIIVAEGLLLSQGVGSSDLSVGRAYQFSLVPDPQIYISLLWDVYVGLGINALYDGIRSLLFSRRTPPGGDEASETVVNITIVDGERSMTAIVKTNDHDAAMKALDTLDAGSRPSERPGRDHDDVGS